MMLGLFFLLAALILFLLAGFGLASGRWNLIALGLACLTIAFLIGGAAASDLGMHSP